MSDALTLEVPGLGGIEQAIGILASCFDSAAMLQIHTGLVRPTAGPPGMPNIMLNRWTMEEQVTEAFANEGVNVNAAKWVGYGNEPKYAAHKLEKGGGSTIGIWDNAESPLKDTFKKDSADHIESITIDGVQYGTKRYYAWDFHTGTYQPWDGVQSPERPIFLITDRYLFQVAKAHQRYVLGKLRAEGQSIQGLRVNL